MREGDLFFALRGRTDGADFAPEAHLRGAVATVATRRLDVPTLVVDDPLEALQRLARWTLLRQDAPSPAVVGITGTVGKTTTKDALATILRHAGKRVSATAGNLNNEIGLPLTILASDPRTEVLVLEMGATHAGDIQVSVRHRPARDRYPDRHLAGPSGLFRDARSPRSRERRTGPRPTRVRHAGLPGGRARDGDRVGPETGPAYHLRPRRRQRTSSPRGSKAGDEGLRFVASMAGESAEVRSPVFGTHLVEPLLGRPRRRARPRPRPGSRPPGASLACGERAFGATCTGLKKTSSSTTTPTTHPPPPSRPYSSTVRIRHADRVGGSSSCSAACSSWGPAPALTTGRPVNWLPRVGVDLLVCVGDEARWYAETFSGKTLFYQDAESAAEALRRELQAGDYLIVKGSRGVGLDTLTRKLRESLALV